MMARYTTFRYRLDPTVEQCDALSRRAGASRFAFNQCLQVVKSALTQRRTDSDIQVAWTGFDLINVFNSWKADRGGGPDVRRGSSRSGRGRGHRPAGGRQVCQQVFEQAAVDLGRGLKAWSDSRRTDDAGRRVGCPRFGRKSGDVPSFRLRNRHPKGKPAFIRVGDRDQPRSITLPLIGQIAVHDDTRRGSVACSPKAGPRSCSRLSAIVRADRSVSATGRRPPTCTQGRRRATCAPSTATAGLVWTAACQRLWCLPTPLVLRSAASPLPAPSVQRVRRRPTTGSSSRTSNVQGMLRDPRGSCVHLHLRARRRQRHQRRGELRALGRSQSRHPSSPGPPSGGPSKQCPPTGRRWPTPPCW